jgi:hypothetical protein
MPQQDLSVDHLISHTDIELIEWVYEELPDGTIYALVNELIERFNPEAARNEITNNLHGEPPDDLLDALEAFRCRQAARPLRDTFGSAISTGESD